MAVYAFVVALIFAYTLVDNVIERPDGIIIASVFIFIFITVSTLSRYWRATELRVSGVRFADAESEQLLEGMKSKKVHLVPSVSSNPTLCKHKQNEIFGEGETGLMVYTILLLYWEWTPEDDIRPYIYLMST